MFKGLHGVLPETTDKTRKGVLTWPGGTGSWTPFRVNSPIEPRSPSWFLDACSKLSLENLSDVGLEIESTVHFQTVVFNVDTQTMGRIYAI